MIEQARMEIRPLSSALGAEIVGIDLSRDLDAATVARIKTAWNDHLVLLFRGQRLSEEDQIRFARHFGALQGRIRPQAAQAESGVTRHPEIMLVSNIRRDGKLIGSLPDGEMQFHSDMCYLETPAKGTFLYAIEIPSQGGDTLFLNMYAAYEALPAALKARVEGRMAVNAYLYGTTNRGGEAGDLAARRRYAHPIVRTHPDTGRQALYVNRLMTAAVEGLDQGESDALLDALFAHIEQERFIHAHHWRVGDLILWDNRCTLHARTDFSAAERRLLRRIVITGDRPF